MEFSHRTYRAVIFDLFGTLVPTFARAPHDEILEQMAKILAVSVTDFANLWVNSYDDRATGAMSIEAQITSISGQLGARPTDDQIAHCIQMRLALTRISLLPRSDAIATLQEFRSRNIRIGLISDCSPEPSVVWSETVLAPLIDIALFSCVEGMCKPDPRLYLAACERLRVQPSECLYVGDGGSRELTGATSIGMHALQLRAFAHEDEPVGYDESREHWDGPTAKRLADLLDLVPDPAT